MKNYLTRVMLLVLFLTQLIILEVKAQYSTTVITVPAASSNYALPVLSAGTYNVRRVTLLCNAGSAPTGFFYDSVNTNLTYTNLYAYSNLTVTTTTKATVFTNSLGAAMTNTYTGTSNAWTAVASNTSAAQPVIGAVAVIAATPYTIDVNWNIAQGLMFRGTNNANGTTIVVEYQ